MITARFASLEDVKEVVCDNEIYNRVNDDNCPPKEEFEIPISGYTYVGGYVGDKVASMFIVHGSEMHYMVLKRYRKYARELLTESFKVWPYKVFVSIPECYKEVINFAKNYGFKEVDIEKKSHKKNGILHDVRILVYEV